METKREKESESEEPWKQFLLGQKKIMKIVESNARTLNTGRKWNRVEKSNKEFKEKKQSV